ncbi:DUF930 domain-containing protein [Rhizobium sp. AQ_MP]|uniref:DUF930 domain-containing protein n=1 Tax=Rhizobium sp. AQ_MP TaxID=2761536 RepID=UPI001639BCAC|nr:DUF930 domain-containing protein [Rhizobium sp. AQ_MP]MBC2774226.1 DUF930 domain-containing protein [Rhizobium sp. AQ_MP]
MTDTRKTGWRRFGGGLALSLLLHGLAVALFLLSFDSPGELSPEDQAVEVTLVAPPPKPEPEPEAEPQPPEPPEPPAKPAEAEPPPPPTSEQPAEPPPVPEPEAPAPAEQATEPELPDAASAPIPVLRPVVRFGERDSGPEIARGTEAERPAEEKPRPAQEAEQVAEAAPTLAQPDIDLPEAPPNQGALPEAAKETQAGKAEAEAPAVDGPTDPAVVTAIAEARLEPREVRELFSAAISGDQAAMTAMAGLTRQERGDQLCGTELSQQLRNGTPGYIPYLLPILRLKEGNVVDVPLAAFRDVNGSWINIAVRCEVNDDATVVVSFSLSVGKAVPKSEWAERGFPDS